MVQNLHQLLRTPMFITISYLLSAQFLNTYNFCGQAYLVSKYKKVIGLQKKWQTDMWSIVAYYMHIGCLRAFMKPEPGASWQEAPQGPKIILKYSCKKFWNRKRKYNLIKLTTGCLEHTSNSWPLTSQIVMAQQFYMQLQSRYMHAATLYCLVLHNTTVNFFCGYA